MTKASPNWWDLVYNCLHNLSPIMEIGYIYREPIGLKGEKKPWARAVALGNMGNTKGLSDCEGER